MQSEIRFDYIIIECVECFGYASQIKIREQETFTYFNQL